MKDDLFKKLHQLRDEYTFPRDKRAVEQAVREVRKAIVRQEASKLDGIKELIRLLEKKTKDITLILAWDKELKEEQRQNLFVERECYQYLISFFDETEAKQTIKSAEKMVEENLK